MNCNQSFAIIVFALFAGFLVFGVSIVKGLQ